MNSNPSDETQNKESLSSSYALHVALQTMKERCLCLQQRLSSVEDENLELRKKSGSEKPFEPNETDQSEVHILRKTVGELTRQKFQLTEHIGMVASENRQLWSRLSKFTKDNQALGNSLTKIKETLTNSSGHQQNLIRSKTFTQNSPNPILRQKIQDSHVLLDDNKGIENLSLEEIPLKAMNDLVEGKIESASKCNDAEMTKVANSLGFGYLNDESINVDLQNDTKKCIDNLVEIKKELLRQQSDLKVALSGIRQRRGNFFTNKPFNCYILL